PPPHVRRSLGIMEDWMMLTHERLTALFDYDPLTGVFLRRIDSGRARAGSTAGYRRSDGYIKVFAENRQWLAHRLAWFYVHGRPPQSGIDHIDGNPSNNRIANLREATQSQNNANAKRPRHNTSGFKGVSKSRGKWQAVVQCD